MSGGNDILVAQLGARMHYAVPKLLSKANRLHSLYTDFATRSLLGLSKLPEPMRALVPTLLRRALSRNVAGVPSGKIHAANWLGLAYAARLRLVRNERAYLRVVLDVGRKFGRHVAKDHWDGVCATYSFNGAGLEILQKSRSLGLAGIVEQTIAPKRVEKALMSRIRSEFPTWDSAPRPLAELEAFIYREEREWQEARLVVCASEFVAQHVARISGAKTKIAIVPYGVDMRTTARDLSDTRSGALRVVSVGAQGLRKGTPYVLAAARRLVGVAEFRLVGDASKIPRDQAMPPNVTVVGAIPRPDVLGHLQWADVLLLPSICEGSATATYEALATGLPIVCTPNAGSVVRSEVEGLVVPPFSSDAIVAAIERLSGNRDLVREMASNATRRSKDFSVDAYGERLLEALDQCICQ